MNIQNLGTIRVPILKLSLGNPRKKYHLDVTLAKSYKIYYRGGVVLPFKGCGPCKACV